MTSLADAYVEADRRKRRRFLLGAGLFAAGAVAVVIGILVGTTNVLAGLGVGVFEARRWAGLFAGLGLPAVFVGIFSVLPARRRERAAAAIGASVAVLGVALFWHAYPYRWIGATPDHLTFPVVTVYFAGALTTFWALFSAVTNFKTRNDPGGTVRLERTIGGETRVIRIPGGESPPPRPRTGGRSSVGVVGSLDRGDDTAGPATSDGGTDAEVLTSPDPADGTAASRPTDRYCGTCDHFDYVQTSAGMRPYCGFHDGTMDDMDPCDAWRRTSPSGSW